MAMLQHTLEESDAGWHEEENDPTPFIRYMLQVILACYTEFEERVGLTANDIHPKTGRFGRKRIGLDEKRLDKFPATVISWTYFLRTIISWTIPNSKSRHC